MPKEKVIHTHPVKKDKEIKYALDFGITQFVIDNEYEIPKFWEYKDRVKVLLWVSFPNPESQCGDLSKKFGC